MCARILKSGKGRSRKAADGLNLRGITGKRGDKRDECAEAVELLPLNKKIPTDGYAASKNGEEMRDESRLVGFRVDLRGDQTNQREFLIAYRSYHYAIHHPSSGLK